MRRFTSAVRKAQGPLRIEIGAWTTSRPGWISTDVHWRGDCYLDATRTWPVPDDSVEYIYADNVVEHLTLEQNRFLLAEAVRALQPGGRIRLVTPDVGALAALYLAGPEAAQALRDELIDEGYAIHHQVDVLRFAFQDDGHHVGYLWDVESLASELTRAGFVDVSIHEAGSSGDPALCGLEVRVGSPVAGICVIVEAVKPSPVNNR
jgi:predicted SAM-dependent methyltransferase